MSADVANVTVLTIAKYGVRLYLLYTDERVIHTVKHLGELVVNVSTLGMPLDQIRGVERSPV